MLEDRFYLIAVNEHAFISQDYKKKGKIILKIPTGGDLHYPDTSVKLQNVFIGSC